MLKFNFKRFSGMRIFILYRSLFGELVILFRDCISAHFKQSAKKVGHEGQAQKKRDLKINFQVLQSGIKKFDI